MKWVWALCAVMAAAPAARAGQDSAAAAAARVAALHLPLSQTQALLGPMQQARAAKLPPGPVGAKILEGLAKHVPPPRIAAAATEVLDRLREARAALTLAAVQARHPAQALADLALAAARLGKPGALLPLGRAARGASPQAFLAAASALAEMQQAGIPVAQASAVLGSLAARRYAPAQIAAVPRLLQQYRAEGGRDDGAFLREIARRSALHIGLDDMVDPFGVHGRVLNVAHGLGVRGAAPGRPEARGQGGRVLVQSHDRGGSNPAADDNLNARQGRGLGLPANGATGAAHKKHGKGPGSHGNGPG